MYSKVLKKCFKFYKITIVLSSFKHFCNLYKYLWFCTFFIHFHAHSALIWDAYRSWLLHACRRYESHMRTYLSDIVSSCRADYSHNMISPCGHFVIWVSLSPNIWIASLPANITSTSLLICRTLRSAVSIGVRIVKKRN